MSLTFKCNKTAIAVTASGVSVSGSGTSWTLTNSSDSEDFSVTIKNTGSQNMRVDDIQIIVTTAHD